MLPTFTHGDIALIVLVISAVLVARCFHLLHKGY